jgi:hypothetical protein
MGASSSDGRVPAVIYYDLGLQSQNYINTIAKPYDASNPSASCAEIVVEPGSAVHVRTRILHTDGSWERKPEISVRQNRWGGGSSGGGFG